MKRLFLLFALITITTNAQVGIGTTTPNASAQLDVKATNKGVLIPRMTQAQRNAIASPATSLLIYQTSAAAGYYYYNGSQWIKLATGANATAGKDIDISGTNVIDIEPTLNFVDKIQPVGKLDIISSNIYHENTITSNIGIGLNNGAYKTTNQGFYNILFGYEAGKRIISTTGTTSEGSQNIAIGSSTLRYLTTNIRNVAIGTNSLRNLTTGEANTALGPYAGSFLKTGSNNVFVGYHAGDNLNIGSNNIFIGNNAGKNAAGNNKLIIENTNADANNALIYGEFGSDNTTTGNILRTNSQFQIGDPTLTGYAFPTTDGTANQVMATDGSGQISFVNPSSIFTNTDNQTINNFSFNASNNLLTLEIENDGIAPQTVNLSTLKDADWYKIGTTNSPTNINDDIYTNNNVKINNGRLDVTNNNINVYSGKIAVNSPPNVTGGISVTKTINNNSANTYYNIFSQITSNSTTNSRAISSSIIGNGTGSATAFSANLSGTGTRNQTGLFNDFTNNNALSNTGVFNYFLGTTTGNSYGIRNEKYPANLMAGNFYGLYNDIAGASTNRLYGAYTNIGVGAGNQYGYFASLSGGTGVRYGMFANLLGTGGGTDYGIYSSVEDNTNGYAAYFKGRVSLGNSTSNRYLMPTADGTANQVMTTNGTGQVSFANVSSIFTETGDISQVIAGNGLIGGALSGIATIHVVAKNGLTTTANDIKWGGTLVQDTNINYGTFDTRFNLNGTGDFIIQDNGTGVFSVSDNGETTMGRNTFWKTSNIAGTTIASITNDTNDGVFKVYDNGLASVILDANSGYVFNEQGSSRYFRIESNANANMFKLNPTLNRISIGTGTSAGTFNVLGNSYFSDDIILRDGAINTGDTLVKISDSTDDGVIEVYENNGVNHRIHGNGTTVFNEKGLPIDFRIESDHRPNMFIVDASYDIVRIGTNATGGVAEQGNTRNVAGFNTTVRYVADFQIAGNNKNTAVGIGSSEFLLDAGNLYIMIHGNLLPYDDAVRSLGTSSWRWASLWATDGTINTSDIRQKKNIKPLSYGLDDIMKIETITFNWKNMPNKDKKIGFSAQNLLNVLPEVVKTHELVTVDEETGKQELKPVKNLGVYYSDIIPVTVKAIQELKNEVDTLKAENKALKQQIAIIKQLEQRINTLEKKN